MGECEFAAVLVPLSFVKIIEKPQQSKREDGRELVETGSLREGGVGVGMNRVGAGEVLCGALSRHVCVCV